MKRPLSHAPADHCNPERSEVTSLSVRLDALRRATMTGDQPLTVGVREPTPVSLRRAEGWQGICTELRLLYLERKRYPIFTHSIRAGRR